MKTENNSCSDCSFREKENRVFLPVLKTVKLTKNSPQKTQIFDLGLTWEQNQRISGQCQGSIFETVTSEHGREKNAFA